MTSFFVCAALLGGVAAIVLARPLWWRRGADADTASDPEVDGLRVQLGQLAALHASGTLPQDQYAQSRALVERKLAQAQARGTGAPSDGPTRPSHGLVAALVAFMMVVAGGGYLWLGSPRDLEVAPGATQAEAGGAAQAPREVTAEQIATIVERLAERLKSKPDDGEGWLMLARSYVGLGKHAQAVDAFVQAARLRPGDADLLADYADALAMKNNRSLAGEPTRLIERALQLDAKNPKALALAGTAAFDRRDYAGAVHYWELVTAVEPADGPYASQLRGAIAEARTRAGMPPAAGGASAPLAPASPPVAAAPGPARVGGIVTLAPALKGRVGPNDTVFVFARALEGPRMPLAILRRRVADLPLTFTLDDSMSMSPDVKLSGVPKVMVGARISRTGNAMPQAGDLQATATAVAVGSTDVQLEISQEVMRSSPP